MWPSVASQKRRMLIVVAAAAEVDPELPREAVGERRAAQLIEECRERRPVGQSLGREVARALDRRIVAVERRERLRPEERRDHQIVERVALERCVIEGFQVEQRRLVPSFERLARGRRSHRHGLYPFSLEPLRSIPLGP